MMSNLPPVNKSVDFDKIDALRKHMLLTVESLCVILGVSRVSYYNWLKGKGVRAKTADSIRKAVRTLVICVSQYGWPDSAVYVADQPTRLKLLQDLLASLDKGTQSQ